MRYFFAIQNYESPSLLFSIIQIVSFRYILTYRSSKDVIVLLCTQDLYLRLRKTTNSYQRCSCFNVKLHCGDTLCGTGSFCGQRVIWFGCFEKYNQRSSIRGYLLFSRSAKRTKPQIEQQNNVQFTAQTFHRVMKYILRQLPICKSVSTISKVSEYFCRNSHYITGLSKLCALKLEPTSALVCLRGWDF